MNKIQMAGVFALAGALIAGCGKDEQAGQETVATGDPNEVMLSVNGKELTRGQIDADVEKILSFQGDKIPADQREYASKSIRHQLAQGFLIENALVNKAKAEGYVVTAADRAEREAEFMKQMAGRPDAPKSFDEFAAKFPLGKTRALEEFENGILIDKMIRAEAEKSGKKDYAAEAKKIVDAVVSNNNSVASSDAAAVRAVNAGMDMDMMSGSYRDGLIRAVRDGRVSMKTLDTAVCRILSVKARLGLFERPYVDAKILDTLDAKAHHALAREAACMNQVGEDFLRR